VFIIDERSRAVVAAGIGVQWTVASGVSAELDAWGEPGYPYLENLKYFLAKILASGELGSFDMTSA
jgi:hypothetical protein